MKAIIQKKIILNEVHSASGIEYLMNKIYVIGDDSSFLYLYNIEGRLLGKTSLYAHSFKPGERIPKIEKADLESLTHANYKGKDYLLTLGSGSKEIQRDKGFLIELEDMTVKELSLKSLYDGLRTTEKVVGVGKLNIEGLCSKGNEIILFARGNISGQNITLTYKTEAFISHLIEQKTIEKPVIANYKLPTLEGWASGFSGAVYDQKNDTILFTATVEKTLNEIDDGETLGSFVGAIDLSDKEPKMKYSIIMEDGLPYKEKVESIAVLNSEEKITALAVTDSDGGDSVLLWIEITL
ncbi:MAG TPA: hypothetical protein VD908_19975 [Cytophagales bacterium]|nr:hypothetical protein [Cytophagales bacterium]